MITLIQALSEKALTTIISVVVSAVVGAVISFFATRRNERKSKIAELEKRQSALEEGTKSLLRAEIIRNYEKYVPRGWMPIYAREALQKIQSAYGDLGGNGAMVALVEKLEELPSVEPGGHNDD